MLFLRISAALALLCAPALAAAQPWAEVGDRQLRQDVELLKAARLIKGPTNSWPLPWSQIADGIEAVQAAPALPPHIAAAAERLAALADRAQRGTTYEARVAIASDEALIRDFGATAREEIDAAVKVSHNLGRLHVSYGAGFRDGQQGDDIHFEPSYAAYAAGNWAIYGGFIEKWYGPGNDGALLFSNSTRPFPKVGIQRLYPYRPEPKFLRWIGPWRFDIFGGVLTEDREDFDDPAVVGIRFMFEPAPGLEIGLNRALQLCGENRPCDLETFGEALFALGDLDNTGTLDEPGNQLAGLDVSYTRMLGPIAFKLYYEAEGEDQDGRLQFDQVGQIGGGTFSGPVGRSGASWWLLLEYTDTLANALFDKSNFPGSFYNNFIYTDGFTFRDRPIGHSIDGDSSLLTVAASVTDTRNRRWYASYRDVALNFTAVGTRNRISQTPEEIDIGTAGVEYPTRFGDFRLEARYMSDRPNTPGETRDRAEFEFAWRTRF